MAECGECNGVGYVEEECRSCLGNNTCSVCAGEGYFHDDTKCEKCQGSGNIECDICNGWGDIEEECLECCGSGEVDDEEESDE